jgi:hypothetical protein
MHVVRWRLIGIARNSMGLFLQNLLDGRKS